jgi:hypothetical protein
MGFTKGQAKPLNSGRTRGTPNKRSVALAQASETGILAGLTPLAFLLEIIRDPARDLRLRLDAAKAALPYCHQRLVAAEDVNRSELDDPEKSAAQHREELDKMLAEMGVPEVLRNAIVWGDTSGVVLRDDLGIARRSERTNPQLRIGCLP